MAFILVLLVFLAISVGGGAVFARDNFGLKLALGTVQYVALVVLLFVLATTAGLKMSFTPSGDVADFHDRVADFDASLAAFSDAPPGTFKVAVLGDSTHNNREDRARTLPWTLYQRLAAQSRGDIAFVSFFVGGLDASDFYLLSQRLMAEDVDLIVLPVNMRSFGPLFNQDLRHFAPNLDRYLSLSEWPFLVESGLGSQKIKLSYVVLDKLDHRLFGQRVRHATFQAKTVYNGMENEQMARFETLFASFDKGDRLKRFSRRFYSLYPSRIPEAHDNVAMFRRIRRLAEENGTHLLLYTVQINPKTVRKLELDQDRLIDDCRNLFGGGPNVRFVDMSGVLSVPDFADHMSHMKTSGINKVTARLSAEILAYESELPPAR